MGGSSITATAAMEHPAATAIDSGGAMRMTLYD